MKWKKANNVKKFLLIIVITCSNEVIGAENLSDLIGNSLGQQEDRLAICHIFKNEQMTYKEPCIVESLYFSGGVLNTYIFGKYKYNVQEEADSAVSDGKLTVNDFNAIYYRRDARDYRRLKNNEQSRGEMNCYRVKAKQIDFCIKGQN